MTVLLMRLAAPMQSWGVNSRFTRRETESLPTKSGVIGIIAAALGIKRDESLDRFLGLRFGVRVDQPGTLLRDYHTAKNEKGDTLPISIRYYLQDAVFLVGLESDNTELLKSFRQALTLPYYPVFLGRRSCPPDGPIRTWLSEDSLEDALRKAPWQASSWYQRKMLRNPSFYPAGCTAEIVVEPAFDQGEIGGFIDTLADEPISFNPEYRKWRTRRIMRLSDAACPKPTVELSKEESAASASAESDVSPLMDVDAFFGAVSSAEGESREEES